MNLIDLSGNKYGSLTVIRQGPHHISPSRNQVTWICICDCGNVTTVQRNSLRSGTTVSCGCAREDGAIKRRGLGYYNKIEYQTWHRMKQRCYNEDNQDYKAYGGRGIAICDRWLNSFDDFFSDMGRRPDNCNSIDRINNDGDYDPSNCRWSNDYQQSRNKSNNVIIEFNGESKILQDWANDLGIHWVSLYERLQKHPKHIALTYKKGMKNVT